MPGHPDFPGFASKPLHASASNRIMEGFARKLGLNGEEMAGLPNERIQAVARALFEESGKV